MDPSNLENLSHEADKSNNKPTDRIKHYIEKYRSGIITVLLAVGFSASMDYDTDHHASETQPGDGIVHTFEGVSEDMLFMYTVQSGDSLSVLFDHLGVPYNESTVEYFCKLNPQFANTLGGEVVRENQKSLSAMSVGDSIVLWGDHDVLNSRAEHKVGDSGH